MEPQDLARPGAAGAAILGGQDLTKRRELQRAKLLAAIVLAASHPLREEFDQFVASFIDFLDSAEPARLSGSKPFD
jgi:hypothetical protein